MEVAGSKRLREAKEAGEEVPGTPPASPAAKRTRADFFFDILDDESEPDNTDLDSVMRSLEEEISLPVTVLEPAEAAGSDTKAKHPDLGFLLEASDDELGLPPAEVAEGEATSGMANGGGENAGGEAEEVGFGKIWGLDDEIHLDFGLGSSEIGWQQDSGVDDGGVIFDRGLFNYDGGICGPEDFSDLTWRPEFLPAL